MMVFRQTQEIKKSMDRYKAQTTNTTFTYHGSNPHKSYKSTKTNSTTNVNSKTTTNRCTRKSPPNSYHKTFQKSSSHTINSQHNFYNKKNSTLNNTPNLTVTHANLKTSIKINSKNGRRRNHWLWKLQRE